MAPAAASTNRDVRIVGDPAAGPYDPLFLLRHGNLVERFATSIFTVASSETPPPPDEEILTVLTYSPDATEPRPPPPAWESGHLDDCGIMVPPPAPEDIGDPGTPAENLPGTLRWTVVARAPGRVLLQLTLDLWGDLSLFADPAANAPRQMTGNGPAGLFLRRYKRQRTEGEDKPAWQPDDHAALLQLEYGIVNADAVIKSPGLAVSVMTARRQPADATDGRRQRPEGFGRIEDRSFSLVTARAGDKLTNLVWSRSADFVTLIPYDPAHHGEDVAGDVDVLLGPVSTDKGRGDFHVTVIGLEGEILPIDHGA